MHTVNDIFSAVERALIDAGLANPRPPVVVQSAEVSQQETCDGDGLVVVPNCPDPKPEEVEDAYTELSYETPEVVSDYVRPEWYDRFALLMSSPMFRGSMLFGPRGTGKTTTVRQLAADTGSSIIVFQCAGGMTYDDLLGIRDVRAGSTVFTPGPVTQAVRDDTWVVLEEANNLNPSVYASLNTLTDGSKTPLRTKDGKRYRVGNKFRVVLCFNEGASYAGTREVNAALKDRLRPIYTPYMDAMAEECLLVSRMGVDASTATSLVMLANACRKARRATGFDYSPRSNFALLEFKRKLSCTWRQAFNWSILDCVGDVDEKAPQRGVLSTVADTLGIDTWVDPVFNDQVSQ